MLFNFSINICYKILYLTVIRNNIKYLRPVVAQGLSSVTHHAMPPKFGRKWGTECLVTRFPMPTLQCAGYSVKPIYIKYLENKHFLTVGTKYIHNIKNFLDNLMLYIIFACLLYMYLLTLSKLKVQKKL